MKIFKLALAATILIGITGMTEASVSKKNWGTTKTGEAVELYTLASPQVEAQVTTFGARLVSVKTADKAGKKAEIVLGYPTVTGYENNKSPYFGAIVGRYGNRIAGGKFTVDGQSYQVPINDKTNSLHGGTVGFDQKVWTGVQGSDYVELTLVSPDGDMGFPGKLTLHVRYTLVGDTLKIDYTATTDKATVINVTNHAYFNLHGDDQGNVLDQEIKINADKYTPVNDALIPTGEIASVQGTPFDFRSSTKIGERINQDNEQLKIAGGYDLNWVLNGKTGSLHDAAQVYDPQSGRVLTVKTTEPGVQFYTGNSLDGSFDSRNGGHYTKGTGLCLETQHFPDSPNHPNFPSTLLKPGQTMHSSTEFIFTVKK